MARSAFGVLILLLAATGSHAAAMSVTDPVGDEFGASFGVPGHAPPIDILTVEGNLSDGRMVVTMELNGTLPIANQAEAPDPDRRYTYIFIVAIGTVQGDLASHLDAGGDAVLVVCSFHHGETDLDCNITQGNATLRSQGATASTMSASFETAFEGPFEIGGAAQISLPNATESQPDGRNVVNEDFTGNALPYGTDTGPGVGDDGFVETPDDESPWWQRAPVIVAAVLAAVAGVVWWRLRRAG